MWLYLKAWTLEEEALKNSNVKSPQLTWKVIFFLNPSRKSSDNNRRKEGIKMCSLIRTWAFKRNIILQKFAKDYFLELEEHWATLDKVCLLATWKRWRSSILCGIVNENVSSSGSQNHFEGFRRGVNVNDHLISRWSHSILGEHWKILRGCKGLGVEFKNDLMGKLSTR